MQNIKDELNIKDLYGKEFAISKEEFIKQHPLSGLSYEKSQELLRKNGPNQVSKGKPKHWYNYFFESLFSTFNLILIGISLVLFYTDVILPETPSYANIIVILILVLSSTFLEFFEEYRSNKAAQKLKELVATSATVIRDGSETKIQIKDIVIGDIVLISSGSLIPADIRIIESKDLYVNQSSLTGESDSVKKVDNSTINIDDIKSITDLDTICFMGTNVISGSAKGVVIKTADDTYFGQIANTLTTGKLKTAFQKGVESISKLLIRFMLVLIPIVFILTTWKHETLTAFTFAVAIAIGITPLLLPVILSSSLSKGAIRMSKKKTIVKSLDSIQSFGAMNILCTDKTGTLTEDKIVLEKYLDIKGEEDIRTLKHAFLNSYFQTGLKGNIDNAVIARGLEYNLKEQSKNYKIIDEIPFDFSRRRLSVIVQDTSGKKQMITKGAVEEILSICSFVDYKGEISKISDSIKNNVLQISKNLNQNGLRVVAICQKNEGLDKTDFGIDSEKDMVLIGFIGFLDPPKESAKIAIKKLNDSGIRVIVLTGDNAEVTKCICEKVNLNSDRIILGNDVERLSDQALIRILKHTNIFAKVSPIQKARIVRLLKQDGNIVGYMGDGINDSPSLINSDVGISVDTAVDIAKESADIILLEKDLNVLLDGVQEGRKTFANLMKYIKLSVSFNFGEVTSVIIASILLPFLPITPIQLLVQSLLYDLGQLTLPFDNVDKDYLKEPRNWNVKSIKNFMLFMGPLSSSFDMIVFASIWFLFGIRDSATFQAIWFSYGIVSNLVGMHIIRTSKKPFIQSNASSIVYISSIVLSIIAIIVPYTFVGHFIGLVSIPSKYLSIIIGVPILYCFVALFAKKFYIKKYNEWI